MAVEDFGDWMCRSIKPEHYVQGDSSAGTGERVRERKSARQSVSQAVSQPGSQSVSKPV